MRGHRRLKELILLDDAPGASPWLYEGWDLTAAPWPASGYLAAAVVILAAAIGIGLSHLHIRLARKSVVRTTRRPVSAM